MEIIILVKGEREEANSDHQVFPLSCNDAMTLESLSDRQTKACWRMLGESKPFMDYFPGNNLPTSLGKLKLLLEK
jgi:hypothetical protein